jgi:PAS domain S-box-containing protein
MIENLNNVTASRDELNREIEERRKVEEELRESKEHLEKLADATFDGIIIIEKGIILEINKAFASMLGYEPVELIGRNVIDFVAPKHRDIVRKNIMAGYNKPYEAEGLRRDGSIFHVEVCGTMINYKGRMARITAVHDITERKRVEEYLRIQRNLSITLSSVTDLEEALVAVIDTATTLEGIDCGGIYLKNPVSGALDFIYSKGLSPAFVEQVSHYEKDTDNVRLVMKGKPIYVDYEKLDVSKSDTERQEGILTVAVIPVLHQGQVIGSINVASHNLNKIPATSRNLLEAIASQVGSVIATIS